MNTSLTHSLTKTLAAALTAAFLLTLTMSVTDAAIIDVGDSLVPDGLAGDTFHLAFITSGARDATSSDITVYNDFVDGQAENSGSLVADKDWTWTAIASTNSVDARDNALVSAPVYNLQGDLIATGFDDIWDGSISNPVYYTEAGLDAPSNHVRTGTGVDGTGNVELGGYKSTLGRGMTLTDGGWISADTNRESRYDHVFYALS